MSNLLYELSIVPMLQSLRNLDAIVAKAESHVEADDNIRPGAAHPISQDAETRRGGLQMISAKVTTKQGFIALSILCLMACTDRTPPEPVDQSIRPARVMTVELANQARSFQLVGRVEAAQSIDLAFEVAGPLQQLPVLEGQVVQQGQLLAALDQSDFQLAVNEAQVQLQLAQQDLNRKVRVLKQQSIARSTVDDAQSVRDLQRVRLEQAKQKLADATLHAPFDGLVAQRFVDNFVNVGVAQPILRLHSNNELHIVANIPEHLTATITPDDVQRVYCTFSFSGDTQFELTFLENRGEASRVAQTVEASFVMAPAEGFNVMPGMTAAVHIELDAHSRPSVVIPLAAVVADPEHQLYVWLMEADNQTIRRQYITVTEYVPEGVVVTQGLDNGDVIVTTGAATLSNDSRIRPLDAADRV